MYFNINLNICQRSFKGWPPSDTKVPCRLVNREVRGRWNNVVGTFDNYCASYVHCYRVSVSE